MVMTDEQILEKLGEIATRLKPFTGELKEVTAELRKDGQSENEDAARIVKHVADQLAGCIELIDSAKTCIVQKGER